MLSCCTHLTALCRGRHCVSTNSEVEWNDIPIRVDRQAPFSPFHALLSGFVWVERCILLISTSATHWSHSVLAPFTSCTVLPSFDLRLNRKAKGTMSFFFCGLQTHLCELIPSSLSCFINLNGQKKISYNKCLGLQLTLEQFVF